MVVEAEVAEEGADDGAVLLLDVVVVVFAVGAGAGGPDVGVVGSEEGGEVVVEEFAAVAFRLWLRSVAVDVDGFLGEGEVVEEVCEGGGGGLGAAVPAGGEGTGADGDLGRERGFAAGAFVGGAPDAVGRRTRHIVEALMRVSSATSAGGGGRRG